MRWVLSRSNPEVVSRLRHELKISPLLARLLALRGMEQAEPANRFLNPDLRQLHDPFLMTDMRVAVARLRQAIERREKILIYGDYDVDGLTAAVILLTALRSLGAHVDAFIPHRLADGYGMRVPVVERARGDGYSVLLSVDTGIREQEALSRARELGIDCIVTDHHLPGGYLPPACAILNPARSDCLYPDKYLSGAGVAFKLVQALLGETLRERGLLSYLKVVAIGTVADVVPLVGENRVIVRFGLEGLKSAGAGEARPVQGGLQALLEVAGLKGRPITTNDVGFRIAPRLNAAGRMEDARDVLELLTTPDGARAREIALRLDALNRERQRVEDEILDEILARMEKNPGKADRYSLVFSGEGWHRGVIGIVAQRLVDRYHRPSLVIGIEREKAQGSGRSIAGFHLLDALNRAGNLFERYGGHAQAAGFTLPASRIEELEACLEANARAALTPRDLERVLQVEAELDLNEVDVDLYVDIHRLEPFGAGNPAPVFAGRGWRLMAPPRILKEKHLKLRVGRGTKAFDALAWGRARDGARFSQGQQVDVAFTLEENLFQEISNLQLVLKDFRAA